MGRRIFAMILIPGVFVTAVMAQMTVKDSDDNKLMQVYDEGTVGSIGLPPGAAPSSTSGKLYNQGGALYWNGSALGTAGSAGGWTDNGTVVRLTTITDKVGIGDTSPTHKLDVSGKIGIKDTQVLYMPDQADFEGTLIVGNGGGSLSHASGNQGQSNTAIGLDALNANTTGTGNTAIGHMALSFNSTGIGNTASGVQALYANSSGSNNTIYGYRAAADNTTGAENTIIGSAANFFNTTGSNNTIVGYSAGMGTALHSKSGNIFIGHEAGFNETGSNKLYIDNSGSATPLIGGDFAADELYLNGKVGIGITSPAFALDVKDSLGINGTRLLYLPDQTDFTGSLFAGGGGSSLSHTSTLDGRSNVGVGMDALDHVTTGNSNTAIGIWSLYWNMSGINNTACGCRTLGANLDGSYNTAIGVGALNNQLGGDGNTAVGHDALVTGGGSNNTAIGTLADVTTTGLTNATAIGYKAEVDASHKVRVGNDSITVIEGKVDFTYTSDRNKKENFLDVDGEAVLHEIRTFTLQSWNYKHDEAKIRHYGPVSQDFYRAFGEDKLGTIGSDTTLCGSDVVGINMIAIQALEKRTAEEKLRISKFEEMNEKMAAVNARVILENEKLKAELDQLKSIVTNLCQSMNYEESRMTSTESR